MLLRWSSLWYTDGWLVGWGVGKVIRSCRGCCYVEDVVTLRMLLPSQAWSQVPGTQMSPSQSERCCPTESLETAFWMWSKEKAICISTMVLWGIMRFQALHRKRMNSMNPQFQWFLQFRHWMTKIIRVKFLNYHANKSQLCFAPKLIDWRYCHVEGMAGNMSKHSKT